MISAPAPEQQAVVPGVVAAAPLRPERSVPPDPRQVRRLWFRIGGAVVAAAGVALVLGGHFSAERDQREYLVQADGASATVWRDRRDDDVMIRNVGLGVLCLGAAGFGVSWVW